MPGQADEQATVVAVVGGPPVLAIGHEVRQVLLQGAVVELLEGFGVVKVRRPSDSTPAGLMTIGSSAMYVVAVVLPAVQAEFGVARADASLPYTLLMVGFGLGGILMGQAGRPLRRDVPCC
jgi:hypothetical protein